MKDIKCLNNIHPVICIFPGQLFSNLPRSGETVFHYNIGIDVIVMETVDLGDIEARVAGLLYEATDLSDFVDNMINQCDDCPDASPDNCNGCICSTPVSALKDYAEGNDKADTGGKGEDDPEDCEDCDMWEEGHNNGFCDECRAKDSDDIDNDGMPSCVSNDYNI
jgi:hypothetical protein